MKKPKNLEDLSSAELSRIAFEICVIMLYRGGMLDDVENLDDVESLGVEIVLKKND